MGDRKAARSAVVGMTVFALCVSLLPAVADEPDDAHPDPDGSEVDDGDHSHFRYGHIYWAHGEGPNTVEFTIQNAWRRSAYNGDPSHPRSTCVDPADPTLPNTPCSGDDGHPLPGDVVLESVGTTRFHPGDGSVVGSPRGNLLYLVTSIDAQSDWLFGLALDPEALPEVSTTITHTYAGAGIYTAFMDTCCRIFAQVPPNRHVNNPSQSYRIQAFVDTDSPVGSPVSVMPPIVQCPIEGDCSFQVPGTDPHGDGLRFRMASPPESGIAVQPGPPHAAHAATVDPDTGVYEWDTRGATLGDPELNTLYSTQVVIDDLDEDGDLRSRSAVDFFIQLVEEVGQPPVFDGDGAPPGAPECGTTVPATVGTEVMFTAWASDPEDGSVTLNAVGLPPGAVMQPSLPVSGDASVTSDFAWTPQDGQLGMHVLTFMAMNDAGQVGLCPLTIQVDADVNVVAMEVTQGVQDWTNSVPLVTDRATTLRAFVQLPSGEEEGRRVTGRLHGERDGQPLPLSPLQDGTREGVGIRMPNDAHAVRGMITGSLNWQLPRSWTHGDVTLRLEFDETVACLEPAEPRRTCEVDLSYNEVDPLEIRFVKVRWRDHHGSGFDVREPSDAAIEEQMRRVVDAVPGSSGDSNFTQSTLWGLVGEPDTDNARSQLLSRLQDQRWYDGCFSLFGCERIYYGVVYGNFGGRARANGHVSWGALGHNESPDATGRGRNVAAHELFHNFGIRHTAHEDRGPSPQNPNRKAGWCEEDAPWSAPDFPYEEAIPGVGLRPTLGPLGNQRTEIWGLAANQFAQRRSGLGIIDPNETFALMSYCNPIAGAASQGRWPSKENWQRVIQQLGGPAAFSSSVTTSEGPHLLVSGVVDLDEGSAQLEPVMPLSAAGEAVPQPEPGPYTLELRDAAGEAFDEVTFDVAEVEADAEGDHPNHGLVQVPIADHGEQLHELVLHHEGQELASLQRSGARPQVSVSATLDGELLSLDWDVDPDGAPEVASTVLLGTEADGWNALAIRTQDTSLVIPTPELPPGDEVQVRVLISDGLNVAEATSEPFTVAAAAPLVQVHEPIDGSLYTGAQLVTMRARATVAGVPLDDEQITWQSDLDGPLGSGSWLDLRADDLSVGEHQLTATATDEHGTASSETVTIEIQRVVDPPDDDHLAQLDVLVDLVRAAELSRGHERALLATIDAARAQLEGGREDQACGPLGALLSQVDAFEPQHLPSSSADQIRAAALQLRGSLGCGSP